MYQQITIIGNLGADPIMRYTPAGDPVTNFNVAVNSRWTNKDGEASERVTWYKITCWGKLAEVTNQYLVKGRQVMVTGSRLEAEAYMSEADGKPKASLRLTADVIKFLGPKGDEQIERADTEPKEETVPF